MTATAIVVAAAALIGCSGSSSSDGRTEIKPYATIGELPEKLSADGTTIVVGDPAVEEKVHVLEDPRCPVVEEFEQAEGAAALRKLTLDRTVTTEYTFASFRDERIGGDGSKRAVNALRAALDEGRFAEYHQVLFDRRNGIGPRRDLTTGQLLSLADKVPGLRGERFDRAVRTMRHRDFVTASQQAYERFDSPDGPGTPTVAVNGRSVPDESSGVLYDASALEELVSASKWDFLLGG
ncbi:DsbA family protein (plasmid) [Streptomyces clavuligerus]|nr:thioredoxin domain-containing protein [Streptomyces clavuligerus]WDN56699.1 DsbA family protein [Streptomyces clavuligerus]